MQSGFGKIVVIVVALAACVGTARAGELKTSYLYNLSDFTGAKTYTSAKISFDEVKNEVYAMSGDAVSVFNGSGMEVYRFDYDPGLGIVMDVAVDPSGDMFLLTLKDRHGAIIRCNFRAEPKAVLTLKGVPPEYQSFTPERIYLRNGKLYLPSFGSMRILVTDVDGNFIKTVDLAALLAMTDKERAETGISNMSIDGDENILFTVPAIAKVFRLGHDGQMQSFGKRGSAPGRFGVVSGVGADKAGDILVADSLRCVVMVFDSSFKFIKEFGFRGFKPGNLIGPHDLLVDGNDRIYVSQIRKRGVSVYQISSS